MPTYTLNELIEKMAPRARRDKALIGRCVDGLGLYAAQIAAENKHSSKIDDLRKFAENLVGYWGLEEAEGVKSAADLLDAFDERVWETKTGGAVTGDEYQSSQNVIHGLYLYGVDMVGGQGRDAMGAILDTSDLMKEIAAAWDYEPEVLADLTARLEAEVRDLLDSEPLPGQPVSGVVNVGYEITQAVMFENGLGIVLAHNPDAVSPFVTWRFGMDDGGKWYEWGHYCGTENRAKIDYISRVTDYAETYKVTEKPLPTAAAEVDAEQNYNMIDGVRNNEGEPKPDLTDGQTYTEIREFAPETLPEEKPSVLDRIRAAQKEPKQPREPKPERDKKKNAPEL
jgi:hypothetical protein